MTMAASKATLEKRKRFEIDTARALIPLLRVSLVRKVTRLEDLRSESLWGLRDDQNDPKGSSWHHIATISLNDDVPPSNRVHCPGTPRLDSYDDLVIVDDRAWKQDFCEQFSTRQLTLSEAIDLLRGHR